MNRLTFYGILSALMLAAPTYGQQADDVFDEALTTTYDKVIASNEQRNYLEAFRQVTTAGNMIETSLQEHHLTASALNDFEFTARYWPIMKSKAEIAYMLGNHGVMKTVVSQLTQQLGGRQWDSERQQTRQQFLSDLSKIKGDYFYLTEQYDSAEIYLKKAIEWRKEVLDYDFEFFYAIHDDLAQLYYKRGQYAEAVKHLETVLSHDRFSQVARFSSDYDTERKRNEVSSQKAICLAQLGRYTEAMQEIEPVVSAYRKSGDKRLYAEALRKKAKIMMLQFDATDEYNTLSRQCYEDYLSISKAYIDSHFIRMNESEREQYWMAEQPFVTDCYRLEGKAPDLLYDVALYSKAVLLQMGREFEETMTETERKSVLASIRTTWRTVREKLPEKSCAIEFIVYERKGEAHLGALVLNKKSSRPAFIPISSVSALSEHIVAGRIRVKDVFADTQNENKINALYGDSLLYSMIWNEQIVKAIGHSVNVYFSPDGILHQLAIEFMTPCSLKGKRFFRLTTTRLLTQKHQKLQTDRMLACGGVEYGLTEKDTGTGNDELAYSLLAPMHIPLSPLPHSAEEIDSIAKIRRHHPEDKILRADSVTEDALNRLLGQYHILHISTHGLFSEVAKTGTDLFPASSDTQLSKSCLFLSGAEKNLHQEGFDATRHDGILSARELAKMDLGNVGLTVLSACMSGLGFITPDGVYGLQRGLKTAGVSAIISTLWSVNDEATSFFIVHFYRNLEKGMSVRDAFWTARESLMNFKQTYGTVSPTDERATGSFMQRHQSFTNQKFNQPYFYNAFILIDGLE